MKAISLFKGAKNVFLIINCITRLWLLIIKFFKVKKSKNHTSQIFLSRRELWYSLTRAAIPYSCGISFYTATLVIINHINTVDLSLKSALL